MDELRRGRKSRVLHKAQSDNVGKEFLRNAKEDSSELERVGLNLGAGVHREACRNKCFEFAVIVHKVRGRNWLQM